MLKPAFSNATLSDLIGVLSDDHRKALRLFEQFERLKDRTDDNTKQSLVETICTELVIHARVEEEFLYPALVEALGNIPLLEQAEVEHMVARQLIGDLESMLPGDDLYDARISVLGEYVRHHIEEEENRIFPLMRGAPLDTGTLVPGLLARREELRSEFDMPDDDYGHSGNGGKPGQAQPRHSSH
jgi:hemerythrin-like domain-containing protein